MIEDLYWKYPEFMEVDMQAVWARKIIRQCGTLTNSIFYPIID
jgi:hypothetical protein